MDLELAVIFAGGDFGYQSNNKGLKSFEWIEVVKIFCYFPECAKVNPDLPIVFKRYKHFTRT